MNGFIGSFVVVGINITWDIPHSSSYRVKGKGFWGNHGWEYFSTFLSVLSWETVLSLSPRFLYILLYFLVQTFVKDAHIYTIYDNCLGGLHCAFDFSILLFVTVEFYSLGASPHTLPVELPGLATEVNQKTSHFIAD